MKHPRRSGRAIIDKDIKFIKRLLKRKPIEFEGVIWRQTDCLVKISNIRKYEDIYSFGKKGVFVYEVDVHVKLSEDIKKYLYWDSVTLNRRVRSNSMGKELREYLVYFNIHDFCVSKISCE